MTSHTPSVVWPSTYLFNRGCTSELEKRLKLLTGKTHLTAWFQLNMEDESAREYLYTEIPQHYVFKYVLT